MNSYLRHIALGVPSLREAEEYYQSIFQMELIGREAELEDGKWYTLPAGKSWEDAEVAGIELGMLALRKGDIILCLHSSQARTRLGKCLLLDWHCLKHKLLK